MLSFPFTFPLLFSFKFNPIAFSNAPAFPKSVGGPTSAPIAAEHAGPTTAHLPQHFVLPDELAELAVDRSQSLQLRLELLYDRDRVAAITAFIGADAVRFGLPAVWSET